MDNITTLFTRPPWPHQSFGVAEAIKAIEAREHSCVTSPTGGGKTDMMIALIRWCASTHRKVLLYANRKMLIDQTIKVLDDSGINYGVIAAGHKDKRATLRDVQIASIQTVHSRVKRLKKQEHWHADVTIVDEAHLLGNGVNLQILTDHSNAGSTLIGFTATPLGISHIYPHLIIAGRNSTCRQCGALVPATVYAPSEMDTSKLKLQDSGDFNYEEIKQIYAGARHAIFGHVFDHWKQINPDALPAIGFAPGVAESKWLVDQFAERGVRCAHIDGEDCYIDGEEVASSKEVRDEILAESKAGRVAVLWNRFVCLDQETEILTESGWVGINDMTYQHKVGNWDNGHVYFDTPNKVIKRKRLPGERMVVLETPRRSIRVTESHQMLYRTSVDGKFLKCSAGELVQRSIQLPVSGIAEPSNMRIDSPVYSGNYNRRVTSNAFRLRSQNGYGYDKSIAEAKRRIAERESLRHKQPNELTLEECELIGFWIGDGNKNNLSRGGIEYRMWQGADCQVIIDRVDHLLNVCGIDHVKRSTFTDTGAEVVQWSLPRGTGFGPQRRRGVFHIEPYLDKDGTHLLHGLDQEQFDAFIKGLWMANGMSHRNSDQMPSSRLMICSANKKQLDCIQAVAVCRGYRASVRRYKQSRSDHYLYLLSMTKQDVHYITKHQMQFDDSDSDEMVWCVETQSGNIITRRHGSVTVMGNCREGINAPWLYHAILATPFGSLMSYIQSVGRVLRKSDATPDRVIISDHGGNYWRHVSPNADFDWDQWYFEQPSLFTRVRMDAIRERREPTPIACEFCGVVRNGGILCPNCHRQMNKKRRMIIQKDGKLKPVFGEPLPKKYVREKNDTYMKWKSMYHRGVNADMSFAQAVGLFVHENGYWPPTDLPMMPKHPIQMFSKIRAVPHDQLVSVQEHILGRESSGKDPVHGAVQQYEQGKLF